MHSALSALDSMDTQHSVPLTLQALSAECEHRVWSHVPVSPDDLWPLSLSLPLTRACLASESIFPVTLNLKSDPGPWQPRPGRRGVCGDKNFGSRKNCDAGEIWSKTFGGGARVQRRQGGEPGEPAARSVETAAARVTRQRRRGRAGGFDDDVHRDGQTYRGCQAVSWPAAG